MIRLSTTLFFSLLFLFSCAIQQPSVGRYDHISDKKVVQTLKKSFTTQGGLTAWENIEELHYEKHTKLLYESGEIELETHQKHDYFYGKNPSINISSKTKAGQDQKIVSVDGNAVKYIDGKLDNSTNTKALNTSVTTALFVIGVPFKMMDKGVILSHEGTDKLEDGTAVEVIKAVYNPTENSNHNKPDTWWYYFDSQDFRMVGYLIQHDGRYSYVRNLDYTKVDGFLFPTKRGSYRVNDQREILFTRAEYDYTNWSVK